MTSSGNILSQYFTSTFSQQKLDTDHMVLTLSFQMIIPMIVVSTARICLHDVIVFDATKVVNILHLAWHRQRLEHVSHVTKQIHKERDANGTSTMVLISCRSSKLKTRPKKQKRALHCPSVSTLVYGPLPLMMAAPEGYNPLNLRKLLANKHKEQQLCARPAGWFLWGCEYEHWTYCWQCKLFWPDIHTIPAPCNSCMHVPIRYTHVYQYIWAAFNISVWF